MAMTKSGTRDFTQGPILKPLLTFAVTVLFALFLQAMYGAVDLLVVGKFGDAADISGVSTGSQIMQTITNVLASFAMGITILLGQYSGDRLHSFMFAHPTLDEILSAAVQAPREPAA